MHKSSGAANANGGPTQHISRPLRVADRGGKTGAFACFSPPNPAGLDGLRGGPSDQCFTARIRLPLSATSISGRYGLARARRDRQAG